eukprot:scaffold261962_cov32-Tisochrysis_lutea.AAC.2
MSLSRFSHLAPLHAAPACSEGGFFNATMKFPPTYPNHPPTLRINSEFWHPNGASPPPTPPCHANQPLLEPSPWHAPSPRAAEPPLRRAP